MKKSIIPALAAFLFTISLSGHEKPSAPRFFSSGEKALLRNNDIMTFVYMKGKGNAANGVHDTGDFLNISALPRGWDKYDVVIVEKAYLRVRPSKASAVRIFNAMTARSGLKGMSYYSISEGAVSRLVLESYGVRSCEERVYKPDESLRDVPAAAESSFLVKDNRLGTICFHAVVEYRQGVFVETERSCGNVSRLGMRVFNNGGYVITHCLVPDYRGGGYFYCSVQVMKLGSGIMKSLGLLKPENFGNRVRGETVHFFKRLGPDISSRLAAFR